MAYQAKFKVHSAHDAPLPIAVKAEGYEGQLHVPSIVLELLPAGHHRHTVTVDVICKDKEMHDAMLKEFEVGKEVELTLKTA